MQNEELGNLQIVNLQLIIEQKSSKIDTFSSKMPLNNSKTSKKVPKTGKICPTEFQKKISGMLVLLINISVFQQNCSILVDSLKQAVEAASKKS